jgi:hypothetical protein
MTTASNDPVTHNTSEALRSSPGYNHGDRFRADDQQQERHGRLQTPLVASPKSTRQPHKVVNNWVPVAIYHKVSSGLQSRPTAAQVTCGNRVATGDPCANTLRFCRS